MTVKPYYCLGKVWPGGRTAGGKVSDGAPITTTVVGSYPQPGWLVDRELLTRKGVPRVRAADVWRVDPDELAEAQEAATLVAIADQERAGIDVITDGEIRRESYFNHFATALSGVDPVVVGEGVNRGGGRSLVPLVNGPIQRVVPVELDAARFLRGATSHQTKVTVPGPFTLSQLAQNEYYPDQRSLAFAYADAINAELRDLAAAGIDVLQLDDPYLQANASAAQQFAVEAINRALEGITATTALHTCYGYAVYVKEKSGGYPFLAELAGTTADQIVLEAAQPGLDPVVLQALEGKTIVWGVINLGTQNVETPEEVAMRGRAALAYVDREHLVLAPDCGMKFLSRAVAFGKLQALAAGAKLL